MFKSIKNAFSSVGRSMWAALVAAGIRGLSKDVLDQAMALVRFTALKELNNTERRAYVIKVLMSRGVPESVARLAVELAVQALKKELENLSPSK